jgi:hypothetical protein
MDTLKQRLAHLEQSANLFKSYADLANTPPPPPPPTAKPDIKKWYDDIVKNHVLDPVRNPIAATKEALSYNPVKGTQTIIAGAQQGGKEAKGLVTKLKTGKW